LPSIDKVTWTVKEPLSTPSAYRHGTDRTAIVHAFNHATRSTDLDEGLTMLVGPDHAGNLLEVGVVDGQDGPVVVHAMPVRPRYLR
jgi:hypothetical protein